MEIRPKKSKKLPKNLKTTKNTIKCKIKVSQMDFFLHNQNHLKKSSQTWL